MDQEVLRGAWAPPASPGPEAPASVLVPLQAEGLWIQAEPMDPAALAPLLPPGSPLPSHAWRHPRVFFPSYVHEWSAGMLHQAATLTLNLNDRLLQEGWELKDATPTNVMFQGPKALFLDHLSPAPRKPGQLGWTAYGQFVRTFLMPLCLFRLRKIPLAWIHLACRDGIAPEQAVPLLSLLDRLRPSVFGLATLPAWFSRNQGRKGAPGLATWRGGDESIARAVVGRLHKGLDKRLRRWAPPALRRTVWLDYDQAGESYSEAGLAEKMTFIGEILERLAPDSVLDLGCNTGRYSCLAARSGAKVVAVDGDPACIDYLWAQASAEGLDILPLAIDLGRPSPALGWENCEELPFLQRCQDRFDLVLALALTHHLLVRERVPMDRLATYFARLTRRWMALEWVPPSDPQFLRLSGPNAALYEGFDQEGFERSLAPYFQIRDRRAITGGGRVLYLLEKTLPEHSEP